jgi:zinc protease
MYFGAVLPKSLLLEPARDALLDTLENFSREPISTDEVGRARTSMLNDFEKIQIDTLALVPTLSEFIATGDWRLFFLYRDRLRKVTPADVQRVASTYLKPANRVMGSFIPTDQPSRAEIPPVPDLAVALAGYSGGKTPEAGEVFDPSPANIDSRILRRSLPNGIRVALLPKKTRGGNVVAKLTLHWGDEASMTNRVTPCSLAGAMLMRGTLKHTRAELQEAFLKLNAAVSIDGGGAQIDTQRPQLADTLRLVAEVLREPAFPEPEFAELKRAAITSAEAQRSDPGAQAGERMARHLSPYPTGHWLYPLSSEERIAALKETSLDDARSCYSRFLGATRAEFVAVGDFDPEAVMKQIGDLFSDWKTPVPYERIRARYFEVPGIDAEIRTPDKANAVLRVGANLKLRDDHPDFPALILGNYLLGGTGSARLGARIREKEGLSYGVYSSFSASQLDEVAGFGVSAIYAPQNKRRIETAVREELARVLRDGYTSDEVAAGKNSLLEARRNARTQDRDLVGRMSLYMASERTFAWDIDFEKKIAALTEAQVRDAMRRHLDPAKLTVMKAGDFKD